MTDRFQTDYLVQTVSRERLAAETSSDIVVSAMMSRYDFGHSLFHKILSKSVIKPLAESTKEPAEAV